MDASDSIAVIAAVISVASIAVAVVTYRRGESLQRDLKNRDAMHANAAMLAEAWGKLGSNPGFLRFHGIEVGELEEVGITVEDLSYLLVHFEAAAFYIETVEPSTDAFPPTSIRFQMCNADATARAWPILKRFFLGTPSYVTRIDATVKPAPTETPAAADERHQRSDLVQG